MATKTHFRVSGKIMRLLGRESVSESIVALFEVLKNSHDADALAVTVSFKDVRSGRGKITIKEKGGDGMTVDDIVNKFFVIGTYSREPGSDGFLETKRYKRKIVGSKGVGRFALETLGREVKIISKPIGTKDKFTFTIDWDKFESREVTVDQVGIDIIRERSSDTEDSGLEIEISRLRHRWDEDALKNLESKIQRLVLPPELQPPNTFNIILDAPEFGYNNKLITVELAKRAYYYLKAELFEDRIKLFAKVKDKPVISAENKNDIITEFDTYEAGEKLTETEKITGLKQVKDLTCGLAKLIVYYFPAFQRGSPERRDALNYYGEVFATLLDSELPKFAGVRIFRDGLRALTYGDPKRDWVERASISRNLSGTVQADRLIGYVLISNEHNSQIKETTNRETAIENQAFLDLREFVIQSMLKFDRYLNRERRKLVEERHQLKKENEVLNQLEIARKKLKGPNSNLSKALRKVGDVFGEDVSIETDYVLLAIDNARESIQGKIKMTEVEMTANQTDKAMASLGYIVSYMIHETNKAIGALAKEADKLRKHVNGERKRSEDELNRIYFKIFESVSIIDAWNQFVDRFTSGLTIEDLQSRKEEILNPYTVTQKFADNAKKILPLSYLDIKNEIDPKLEIKMFGAYFESIIGNLMTNSIKAIDSLADKETRENKITIKTEKTNQHLIIYFSDNGPGIPKEMWETVFDSHVSSTSKSPLKGHGLGLPITRSILRDYDGEIEIIDPLHGQGTSFRIRIPWQLIDPKGKQSI